MVKFFKDEITAKELLAFWDSIGPADRIAFRYMYVNYQRRFNEYGSFLTEDEKKLFKNFELEFEQQKSGLDRNDDERDTGIKLTHRVNGRATRIEEQILHDADTHRKGIERRKEIKSKTYSINDKTVTARKKT